MKKYWIILCAGLLSMGLLAGCAGQEQNKTGQETLSAAADLIGQADADVKDLFGGGEENWTEDQSTYIGRIYTAELYDVPVTIYTACDADNLVSSVSIWISDGTQAVSEEQLAAWQGYISDATGVSMEEMPVSEESGTQSWRWQVENTFYTLRLLGDILTLDLLPAVGELH